MYIVINKLNNAIYYIIILKLSPTLTIVYKTGFFHEFSVYSILMVFLQQYSQFLFISFIIIYTSPSLYSNIKNGSKIFI